jgi:hypothetical protein
MFNGTLDQRLPNVLCKLVEGFMSLRVRHVLSLEEQQTREQVCHLKLETNDSSNLNTVALQLVSSEAQSDIKLWTLALSSQLISMQLSTFRPIEQVGRLRHICLAEICLMEDARMFKCVKTIFLSIEETGDTAAQTEAHCRYDVQETQFYLKFIPLHSWVKWQSCKMFGYAYVSPDCESMMYVVAQVHDTSKSWLDEVLQSELTSELEREQCGVRRLWTIELDRALALDDPALLVS